MSLYIKNKDPFSPSFKNEIAGESSSFTLCEESKRLRELEEQHIELAVSVY